MIGRISFNDDVNASDNEPPRENVVVSASALIGWDEYLTRSMQREYRIIQALKEHRRRMATRASKSSGPPVHGGMTLDGARKAIVRERCEALRPKAKWTEIAESLGISSKTLWEHRREMYDSNHKFHPDQAD